MTKQECAVLMAHTGIVLLEGSDMKFFYQYLEYKFGRPVYTHELPKLSEKIKKISEDDFNQILENAIDMEEIFADWDDLFGEDDDEDMCDPDMDCRDCDMFEECHDMVFGNVECEGESCDIWDECEAGAKYEYLAKSLPFRDEESDPVNHPKHYQSKAGVETIEMIEAFTEDLYGIEAVCTGNVLKYMCRWKDKNGLEDVKKAKWYLEKLINHLEDGEY